MTKQHLCPTWLPEDGKAYWRRVAPSLRQDGKLTSCTFDLLAAGAQAYASYREALRHLTEEGRVITAHTGATKANPWLTVEKQAFECLCRVSKELQLAAPNRSDGVDELADFLEDK